MTALEAYILARAYTQQAIAGAGALKGAPCQIQSIIPITGGNRITFAWENSEGVTETDTLDVMDGVDGTNGTDGTDGTDGVGISSITFKEKDASGNNVYTVTLSNTNTYDITCPIGPQGETGSTGATGATGNGIASITKTGTEGLVDTYTITYTNGQTSTFTVTNGQTPTVDSAMSDSSANPVENRVIDAQLKTKANQTQLATVEASTTASKAYSANEYLVLGGVLYKVTDNIAQGGTIVTEGAGKNVDLATVGGELATLKSGLTNHENKNNVVIGWDNRNLWDEQGEQGIYNTETGEKGTGNNFRCKNYIPCEPETKYYMVKPNIGCYVLFYTSTKQFIRSISLNADAHVITTPENAKYITFYMFLAYGTTYNNDISFNADNTDTVYHKYHPVIGPAVEELQSGLTNVDVALSVPDGTGKNLMPMTLEGIKSTNTSGTWDGDNYTLNGITMAIQKDTNGNVIGLKFTGTSSSQSSTYFYAGNFTCKKGIGYRMNGCPAGGGGNTYLISISGSYPDTGSGSVIIPFNVDTPISARISVAAGYAFAADGVVFTPMIRYSWVDDSTFAPYIPSVESRIEAVESGKANVATYNMVGGQTVNIQHTGIVAIMSDRGGLYCDGIANRGLNDLVASTQVTVTHVDAAHVTVANNSQYGTSILVLSDGDITITLVQ